MSASIDPRGPPVAVSVVVPVYRSEENVGPLHDAVRRALEQAGLTYELILVDDACTHSVA